MPKLRFAVSIRVESLGVYEVQAASREEAMRMTPDHIRSGRSLVYREDAKVQDAMLITLPDEKGG